MAKLVGVVLAVMLLQEPPATTVTLVPPRDAKPADVEKAAKAIEKRCADFGYKGVKAKAISGNVEVSCETGIPEAMENRVAYFGTKPYNKVEFMLQYPMTPQESEQYEPGKTAPKEASWVKLENGDDVLVIDGSRVVIPVGKLAWKRTPEKDQTSSAHAPYFEFPEDMTKAMRASIDVYKKLMPVMLIDGRRIKSGGMLNWANGKKKDSVIARWRCEEAENETVGICLNNPLPFALEVKK